MSYTLTTMNMVDFMDFVDAFNSAYQDYYVPMHLNDEVMRSIVERESIEDSASVVAVDGDKIVGMGMLGIRNKTAWIGGMGVVPNYRRQGIARAIMEQLLANGRQLGLNHVDLEVITQNTPAYTLYQEMGFQKIRTLGILDRAAHPVEVPGGYAVKEGDPTIALGFFEQWHDVPNPWQRSKFAIEYLVPSGMQGRYIYRGEQLLGYALGWFNNERVQFMDAAIDPRDSQRREVAYTLFASILNEKPKASSGMINVGEDDMILGVMQDLGFRQSMRQYEMRFTF